jgi:DNA-binding CsgD family transcriptional regulator/N-acetylneuraminic acid mutarotase
MENHQLSDREIEILRLVADGKSNKEIAVELFISINTVKVHLSNIFQKINVNSRTNATLYAIEHNLVAHRQTDLIELQEKEIGSRVVWDNPLYSGIQRSSIIWTALPVFILLVGLVILFSTYQGSKNLNISTPSTSIEQRWLKVGEIKYEVSRFATANYDSKIYLIGGEKYGNISPDVRVYDPQKNETRKGTAKPTPVKNILAGIIGELCYVPGGSTIDQVSNVLEVYNPRLDQWNTSTPIPQPLAQYALATFEGKLYLFGGNDGTRVLDTVYIYDPSLRAWSKGTSMPVARQNANATQIGNRILIIGGDDGNISLLDTNEYYPGRDGETGAAWLETAQMPESCNGCKSIASGSNVFLFNKNLVHIYDSNTGVWIIEKRTEAPVVAQFGGVESFRNGAIILGGIQENGKYSKDVWFYVTQYSLVIPFLNN